MRAVARTWAAVARSGIPVQVTSWWRDPTRNASAGGQTYSQHLLGCAMDAVSPVGNARLLAAATKAAALYGTQAIMSERGAVHVQGLPYGMVRSILTREPNLVQTAALEYGPAQYVA
jgi:hypothetical protein